MKKLKILCVLFFISGTILAQNQVLSPKKQVIKSTGTLASKPEKIILEDIDEWLCPNRLERGDREFGGNGPKVKSEVKLRLANNGTEIWADITFSAAETNTIGVPHQADGPKKCLKPLMAKKSQKLFQIKPQGLLL